MKRLAVSTWLTHCWAFFSCSEREASFQKKRLTTRRQNKNTTCGHTEPAVDEAKKSAVGRDIEGHDGDEGQRRKNGFQHRQQDRDQRPQPFKAL